MAISRLIIAGFTGRSQKLHQAHIAELRQAGIPTPERTPSMYQLNPSILTSEDRITVEGENTSGEAEPVIIRTGGEWILCIGSDHTDRDLERVSIAQSKEACPKVIGRDFVMMSDLRNWDQLELCSWIDDQEVPYQAGSLGSLLPVERILELVNAEIGSSQDGDAIFLGTIPVNGVGLVPASQFRAELRIPDTQQVLSLKYEVQSRTVVP